MGRSVEPLSRRAVLRGIGATLFLPLLDAMGSREALAAVAGKGGSAAPVRMAVLYMPNGVNQHQWKPDGVGKEFKLSSILEPLAPHKSDILVLSELMNKQSI